MTFNELINENIFGKNNAGNSLILSDLSRRRRTTLTKHSILSYCTSLSRKEGTDLLIFLKCSLSEKEDEDGDGVVETVCMYKRTNHKKEH